MLLIIDTATINIPPNPKLNPLYILLGNYPIANPMYMNIIKYETTTIQAF